MIFPMTPDDNRIGLMSKTDDGAWTTVFVTEDEIGISVLGPSEFTRRVAASRKDDLERRAKRWYNTKRKSWFTRLFGRE
jgi:hypothetical protein